MMSEIVSKDCQRIRITRYLETNPMDSTRYKTSQHDLEKCKRTDMIPNEHWCQIGHRGQIRHRGRIGILLWTNPIVCLSTYCITTSRVVNACIVMYLDLSFGGCRIESPKMVSDVQTNQILRMFFKRLFVVSTQPTHSSKSFRNSNIIDTRVDSIQNGIWF